MQTESREKFPCAVKRKNRISLAVWEKIRIFVREQCGVTVIHVGLIAYGTHMLYTNKYGQ